MTAKTLKTIKAEKKQLTNMGKLIMDLCGGTGSWSKPWLENGYQVINVTLPEYDVRTYELPDKPIYGILAAPPCTMFSVARTTASKPRDLRQGMEIVEACLRLIWEARKRQKIGFWALENPTGLLRQFLGKPALVFQPCDYGDLWTKRTDVWGYFKEPIKSPIEVPDRVHRQLAKNNRILPRLPEGYIAYKIAGERSQAARRAMTPPSFAKAFYDANK